MRHVFLLLLFFSHLAFGETASGCIQLGTTDKARSIKNTCGELVVVFWCHNSNAQGTQSGICGGDQRYYKLSMTLKPGQTESNPYSQPLGSLLSYGACLGSYDSYKYTDNKGGYQCKPGKAGSQSSVRTTTVTAKTADEACKEAQAQAKSGSSSVGECNCESRGKGSACRVKSVAPKPEETAYRWIKDFIRDVVTCQPTDEGCKSSSSKLIGIAIRG